MIYQRDILSQIKQGSKYFPVIAVIGSRQSGKTTLIKNHFPEFAYYNLENPSTLQLAMADPIAMLNNSTKGIFIDEIQRYPEMLSYIQAFVDEHKKMGKVIVSGSQNLLISDKISQTLSGRAAYYSVYPLSLSEMDTNGLTVKTFPSQAWYGFYPAIYDRKIPPPQYYEQYIATYIERDVREIKNIGNLALFRKFMGLIAGRVGQLLNNASLANDVGVSAHTIEEWLSVMEASYVIYRLQPYFHNLGKRLIKTPKIYFYDTGVLCHLLGLDSADEVSHHYGVGSIFENLVISNIMKEISNRQTKIDMYFYRDSNGNEIDLILKKGEITLPIEIKSGETYASHFSKYIDYWRELKPESKRGAIIYNGKPQIQLTDYDLLNWRSMDSVMKGFDALNN